MTSSSPDSVVEADVLAGELFECEEEEEEEEEQEEEEEKEEEKQEEGEDEKEQEELARKKRQETAADTCDIIGVAEPLGSFPRDSHPEGSSCYWHAGMLRVLYQRSLVAPRRWAELLRGKVGVRRLRRPTARSLVSGEFCLIFAKTLK